MSSRNWWLAFSEEICPTNNSRRTRHSEIKTFCSASCLKASCQSNEDWYEGHCCRLLGQDSDNQHQSCNFCGLRTPVSDFPLHRIFAHYTSLHCLSSCFGWHNDGKWRPPRTGTWNGDMFYVQVSHAKLRRILAHRSPVMFPVDVQSMVRARSSCWHPEQAGRCQASLCAPLQRCQQVTAISETLHVVASASAFQHTAQR